MNAGRTSSMSESLRWGICFALVLCFHVGGAAALLARWSENADLVANAPLIMIELAPIAVAPDITPNELRLGPQQIEAQPAPTPQKPLEKIELAPDPKAELQVTPPPKPVEQPKEKKPKQRAASLTSAASPAEHRANRAAAPMPGATSRDPNALQNWRSQLVAQIERHKRYDGSERGVAQVAFSVDRSGGMHHARVVASSGSAVLDRDAMAWLARSQPLPPPPPDMDGTMIPVTVPLRYNYR